MRKIFICISALLVCSQTSLATPGLQRFCPEPYSLSFTAKTSHLGNVSATGSSAAKSIHFSNPYMRNKPNPAFIATPALDDQGYFLESYVDPGREPIYEAQDNTLFCYYVYPQAEARYQMERLVMVSDSGAFQQCPNGDILPKSIPC